MSDILDMCLGMIDLSYPETARILLELRRIVGPRCQPTHCKNGRMNLFGRRANNESKCFRSAVHRRWALPAIATVSVPFLIHRS